MNKLSKNEKKLRQLIKKWKDSPERIWQEKRVVDRISYFESLLGSFKNKKILDLGCGMGGLLTTLRQRNLQVAGIDFNFDYCLITKLRGQRYNVDNQVIQGVGERLPFKNNSFDLIFCLDVLEHVKEPRMVLREIKRVLKKNGRALLTVINCWSLKDPHYHLPFINFLPRPIGELVIKMSKRQKDYKLFKDNQKLSFMHYFSKREFFKLCETLAFKIQDIGLYKIKKTSLIQNENLKKNIDSLKKLHLASPFYKLYSFFIQSTWEFLLETM